MKRSDHSPAPTPPSAYLEDSSVKALYALLNNLDDIEKSFADFYFKQGRVTSISWDKANRRFSSQVGNSKFRVNLYPEPEKASWSFSCNCGGVMPCRHLGAVVLAVLSGKVHVNMQEGGKSAATAATKVKATSPKPPGLPAEKLFPSPLNAREKEYLLTVWQTYREFKEGRKFYIHSLLSRSPYQRFHSPHVLLPARDVDFKGFWNVLALQLRSRSFDLPDFMRAIEDDEQAQQHLLALERQQAITTWQNKLSHWGSKQQIDQSPGRTTTFDCRCMITGRDMRLAISTLASPVFRPVKGPQLRELLNHYVAGLFVPVPEAAPVAAFFHTWWLIEHNDSRSSALDSELCLVPALRELGRHPESRSRLTNHKERPFDWPEEPLRWKLLNPEEGEPDVRYQLTDPSGAPVTHILSHFNSSPPLYILDQCICTGPKPLPREINANFSDAPSSHVSLAIPREALLTRAGAQFLETHDLPMPPYLARLIKRVPLHLKITVGLADSLSSAPDKASFRFLAVDPDGNPAWHWTGGSWYLTATSEEHPASSEDIIVYDYDNLPDMRLLLSGPLNIRWEDLLFCYLCKITKKFPRLFADWIDLLPADAELIVPDELKAFTAAPLHAQLHLECEEAGELDWFDIRVVVDVGDVELTPEELKALLDARGGFVELEGKGWQRLKLDITPETDERLAHLGLDASDFTSDPIRAHALQLADPAAEKLLAKKQFREICERAARVKTNITPPVPPGIKADLRHYQVEGFHFLAYLVENNFGGILADDMGLGKTLQALTWLLWLRDTEEKQPVLVVCPKSVTDNWQTEAAQFAPGLSVAIWRGADDEAFLEAVGGHDLTVINYAQLRLLSEAIQRVKWLAAILDEGQYIKTPHSQTAVAARAIPARHRIVLTGTPIENRLLDLWSLMQFAMPGLLGVQKKFAQSYDQAGGPHARLRLASRVRPFLLRRTKTQVAPELPARSEEDLVCDMNEEQATLYRAELKTAQQCLLNIRSKKQFDKERFNFLTSLLRLRQICCHPSLVTGRKPTAKTPSAKEEALFELLEPLVDEGHKVLIFSQFVSVIDLLAPQFKKRKWKHFVLTGATENRGDLVKEFQRTEGSALFLISLKAGGFGLNLTAASYVVLFDPWWNPAVENQAIDRTHRIGQTEHVMAYRLIARGSIEEKIRTLQKAKSAMAADILGEEKFAQSLTIEDMRFLLEDSAAEK